MEKIDLSTNSRKIQESYNKVVSGDPSATFAVYSVDKSSALEVTEVGEGPLEDFVENFTDGQIQFGLARVIIPGSDVSKNLLLGWCPDNAPAKSRLSFATNFAEVSKIFSGYHVQITARDQDDLDIDEFLHRLGAAAGARYSIQSVASVSLKSVVSKPAVTKPTSKASSNPSFAPKSTGKPIAPITPKPIVPKPNNVSVKPTISKDDSDEWGGEAELEERDFDKKPLEDVPSAYKPTKVDINALRGQKSDTISSTPKPSIIQNSEAKDTPVKPLNERIETFKSNESTSDGGRLTSLPKPKISSSVSSRYTSNVGASSTPTFGAKPVLNQNKEKNDKASGGISRNFAAEGGKTPAQLWAEKRGQYKSISPENIELKEEKEIVDNEEVAENPGKSLAERMASLRTEELEDQKAEEPVRTLPARNLPPPPPARNVDQDEDEETVSEHQQLEHEVPDLKELEQNEKEISEGKSVPIRNLPPPPVRNIIEEPEVEVSELEHEPESENKESEQQAPPSVPERANDLENKSEKGSGATAIAEYDYEKDEDNEIGFNEGDLIIEIDFVDEEWWSGKHSISGEVGLFPASYVSLQEDNNGSGVAELKEEQKPLEEKSGPSATAEYDYEKDEDNEISFVEGDIITDIEFVDEDWWSGKNSRTNETGLFPANYVSLKD